MERADPCATAFRSHLGCTRCRHLPSVPRLLLSLLYVSLLSGVVTNGSANDRRLGQGAVPQASVESRQIRLPIIDGANIRFARFYTIEGPSKSNAGPFVQDDQGFVWFGTPYGLNRFDGYNFKVFTHDPGNPKSTSGSSITALFKDHNGSLWVGCNQFLNKFDSTTETFTRYRVSYVFHISQDAAGTLWLSTPSGLYSLVRQMEIFDGISTIKTTRRASRAMTLSPVVKTERADSGLPPARASIHSIEELAKLHCIYPCMNLRTHSLSTKIASECSGSIMFLPIHCPYLTGRHTP